MSTVAKTETRAKRPNDINSPKQKEKRFKNSLVSKPWLDAEGAPLSDIELKQVSASWTPTEWETYLSSLEVGLKESQVSLNEMERLAIGGNIFERAANAASDECAKQVRAWISTLTPRQALVIKKIFFEGQSSRQISRTMGISRQRVSKIKKQALRQLKNNPLKGVAVFPMVEGEVESPIELMGFTRSKKGV